MRLSVSLFNATLISSVIMGTLSLSACETVPVKSVSQAPTSQAPNIPQTTQKPASQQSAHATGTANTGSPHNMITEADYVSEEDSNDYPPEPYVIPNLPTANTQPAKPVSTTVPQNPTNIPSVVIPPPSHSELLERARQNSKSQQNTTTSGNSRLPAFNNLMEAGIRELKSGQLTAAENSFTRAQRLNPKSSAVYFHLSQVAIKKNQPRKAEAMARRGLSFTTESNQRNALWQLILRSGQLQNNARVIKEAQQALR